MTSRPHRSSLLATLTLMCLPLLPGCDEARADGIDERSGECIAEDEGYAALATGLVSLTAGQQALVHVTRLHPPDPGEPLPLLVSLVDAEGNALKQYEIILKPGQSDTLAMEAPADSGRILLRAAVSVSSDDGLYAPYDDLASGGIQASLEIVDAKTGQTNVFVNPVIIKGFNPQPEPPAVWGGG